MVNTEIRLIIVFAAKDGEAPSVSRNKMGADCDSDHELLFAKFRLKLNKIGKTNISCMYDLNQTSYDYTVEVINKFKGIDLVEGEPEELRMEVRNIVQEEVTKIILKKKKCKKAKWLSEETTDS